MIFRGGGGEGGDDIYIPKEGREDIGKFAYYLSIVFITPSKEVSLESIFQVALLSHISRPRRRGAKYQVLNTKFQLAAIFNHPKLGTTYLYLLCDLSAPTLLALKRKRKKYGTILL